MKRKLSFLIAAIMILSLLPAMSVSAKTSNNITGTVMSVSSDFAWAGLADKHLTPVLVLSKTDDAASSTWATMQFSLNLTGAKWDFAEYPNAGWPTGKSGLLDSSDTLTWNDATTTLSYGGGASGGTNQPLWNTGNPSQVSAFNWRMVRMSDTWVDVRFEGTASADDGPGDVYLPLCVEMTGEGTARVAVTDPSGGTGLSVGGSYAFATAYSGATKTTIEGTVTSSKDFTLKQITIAETRASTLDFSKTGRITLTAPTGFKWDFTGSPGGDDSVMTGAAVRAGAGFDYKNRGAILNTVYKYGSDDTTIAIYYNTGSAPSGLVPGRFISGLDADDSVLGDNAGTPYTNSGSQRPGALLISGLKLTRERSVSDTPPGDMNVRVSITGGTTETIKVGTFASRSMEMVADDKALPEIVSGVYKRDHFNETTQVLDVTLKELVAGAWNANFDAVLSLTDGVKFRGVEIKDVANVNLPNGSYAYLNSALGTGAKYVSSGYMDLSDTKLTFSSSTGADLRKGGATTDAMMIKMRVYVTVKPGFTGEIKLYTHDDTEGFGTKLEATVAKAINPFEVTALPNDVSLGYMNIGMSDITIKENQAGAIRRTDTTNVDVYVDPSNVGTPAQDPDPDAYLFWIGGYTGYWGGNGHGSVPFKSVDKFENINGDLLLDSVGTHQGMIKLEVKRASTTPSEFKIVGIKLDADRTIPEGKLELRIGGAAASNFYGSLTGSERDYGSFDVASFNAKSDYINIVTAAPDKDTKYTTEVEVTIGSTKLIANGIEQVPEMDAAPFIQDGYTMVPVRAVSVALGVSNDQVIWNGATKTVTILDTGRGRQAQFTANSNYITISGGMQVPFEGPSCTIKDGRAFLPFRALGEIVLACPVSWNDETKTAYFNEGGSNATAAAPAAPVAEEAAE